MKIDGRNRRSRVTVMFSQEMGIGLRSSCVRGKDVSGTLPRAFEANEFPEVTAEPKRNHDLRVFRLSHRPVQLYRLVNQPSRKRKSIAGVCWRIDLCCAVTAASLVGPDFAGTMREHHAFQDAKRFGLRD